MDISIAKVKIIPEMVGKNCLIPVDDLGYEEINKIPFGEFQSCELSEIKDSQKRSVKQIGIFFAGCKEISVNSDDISWNTPEKVADQIKIALRLYEYYIWYENKKTGVQTLNVKTKSISFKNLGHLESCGFFTEAFKLQADRVKMSVNDWIKHLKSLMGKDFVCHSCGKVFSRNDRQRHHKFSNTKVNKALYPEYINHADNIQMVCSGCNVSHTGQGLGPEYVGLTRWSELKFCQHFSIDIRSKTVDKVNDLFGEND